MNFEFMKNYLAKPNESLWEHTEKLIRNAIKLKEFGYITMGVFKKLEIACRYHDIGKMNREFQQRIKTKSKFNDKNEVGHNLLSGFLVDMEKELLEEDYAKIVYIVVNHHHYYEDNFLAIEENKKMILNKQNEILDILEKDGIDIKRYEKMDRRTQKYIKAQGNQLETRLLKGFLHKCDYAASSGLEIEFKNDFLEDKLNSYFDRKNFKLNKMQTDCQVNKEKNIFVIAPTGMGKTEAAMLWLGNAKGIYVLPLKTAINEIYRRIKDEILQEKSINDHIGLLHGDTFPMYMETLIEKNKKIDELEYQKTLRYFNETKNLSLPITISTPDQIFNFVYHYNGYELKLANLSYSKVIIDEIQAYSADLLAYLVFGLQSLVEAGGKFAIFTATFPPFIKTLLGETFNRNVDAKDIGIKVEDINDRHYDGIPDRHYLEIREGKLKKDDIIEIYKKNEKQKILVVCETVKEAQKNFKELSKDCECKLLHGKFIYKDRKAKESQIMNDGKTFIGGTEKLNDKKVVWIATQIVEASLDIDFDYLFTGIVDLNSLFQRLGRVNRKGKKSIDKPNCFIYKDINENLYMTKDRKKGFIDEKLHDLSVDVIKEKGDGIITEKDKQKLINKFTYEKIKGSQFLDDYKYFYDKVAKGYHNCRDLSEVKKIFRNIISYKAIPRAIYDKDVKNLIKEINVFGEEIKEYHKERNSEEVVSKKIDLTELKQKLNEYCFQANMFDIKDAEQLNVLGEKIYVVEGTYNEDIGYIRGKNGSNKDTRACIL